MSPFNEQDQEERISSAQQAVDNRSVYSYISIKSKDGLSIATTAEELKSYASSKRDIELEYLTKLT